jgi:hypothetical protein
MLTVKHIMHSNINCFPVYTSDRRGQVTLVVRSISITLLLFDELMHFGIGQFTAWIMIRSESIRHEKAAGIVKTNSASPNGKALTILIRTPSLYKLDIFIPLTLN